MNIMTEYHVIAIIIVESSLIVFLIFIARSIILQAIIFIGFFIRVSILLFPIIILFEEFDQFLNDL